MHVSQAPCFGRNECIARRHRTSINFDCDTPFSFVTSAYPFVLLATFPPQLVLGDTSERSLVSRPWVERLFCYCLRWTRSHMPKSCFIILLFDGSFLILTSWTGYEAEGGCKFYGRLIPFWDCKWTERALCMYVVLLWWRWRWRCMDSGRGWIGRKFSIIATLCEVRSCSSSDRWMMMAVYEAKFYWLVWTFSGYFLLVMCRGIWRHLRWHELFG